MCTECSQVFLGVSEDFFKTRVVKADFLKAVREAVAQRLIKAVKRLLYVVNKTNDCFKMHLTSVRLWASTFHY